MTDVGANISLIREKMGLSRAAFAEPMGVSADKIKHIETGKQRADHEVLAAIRATYDVDLNDLLSEGFDWEKEPETSTKFVQIPRYTVSASAGPGAIAGDYLDVSAYAFRLEWLKRRHLDHKKLAVIEVRGDSMEPKLSAGDLILLDQAQTSPIDGNTYVVRLGEELVVKNMQRIDRETIALISNNAVYPPRHIEAKAIGPKEEIDIIGRIVASMHEW